YEGEIPFLQAIAVDGRVFTMQNRCDEFWNNHRVLIVKGLSRAKYVKIP
ncbi:unnamed protein product, partial [marine sediment metagenome]